jgi:hypothetical protein
MVMMSVMSAGMSHRMMEMPVCGKPGCGRITIIMHDRRDRQVIVAVDGDHLRMCRHGERQ